MNNVVIPLVGLKPRNCKLQPYEHQTFTEIEIDGDIIAYASPDSTYTVTRRILERAQKSILIGIYDFTAPYMRDLLVNAVKRGVKVELMLDRDNLKGEPKVWDEMLEKGVLGIDSPSCASQFARHFPCCHEKVIVVDDEWTLVQSGNYTEASIPKNEVDGGDPFNFERGNRDTGVAVRSLKLAQVFSQVLRGDIELEKAGEAAGKKLPAPPPAGAPVPMEAPEAGPQALEAAISPRVPPRLFSSRRFRPGKLIKLTPVLSPDNYMQVIPGWLASATRSIYVEQQYIRAEQPQVQKLLGAIRQARENNPRLNICIVLARPRGWNAREQESLDALLSFGFKMGDDIRYLNPRYFDHCHNKLIVVDRRSVLVSSQNWSDSAVSENREAGLLLHYSPVARYFAGIFTTDWENGLRAYQTPKEPQEDTLPVPAEDGATPAAAAPEPKPAQMQLSDFMEV